MEQYYNVNPLTDSGARILGLTQLLASAEMRLANRRETEGRQPDDDIHVNNFSKMLTGLDLVVCFFILSMVSN